MTNTFIFRETCDAVRVVIVVPGDKSYKFHTRISSKKPRELCGSELAQGIVVEEARVRGGPTRKEVRVKMGSGRVMEFYDMPFTVEYAAEGERGQ
jgi:hypothetical protein